MHKAFSGSADDLIDYCKSRPSLQRKVHELALRRYSVSPDVFGELVWILVADALCEGARAITNDNIEELDRRMAKS